MSRGKLILDIGIFAYNEEKGIDKILADLAKQSFWKAADINVRIFVLANGCVDKTVFAANQKIASFPKEIQKQFSVANLPFKGKSKTWNYFVHEISDLKANFLLFMDGDIRLPNHDHVENMLLAFDLRPSLLAFNSRPVKEIPEESKLNLTTKLISSMGGTFSNFQTSICGQCYMVRASALKSVYMPIGLPVEDGFIRAILLTDCLTAKENLSRIWGEKSIWHTYASITGPFELIRHQVRILIGSAINAIVFSEIIESDNSLDDRLMNLKSWSKDETHLANVIERRLPRSPYGYIPFSFLTKRWTRILSGGPTLKRLAYASIGFIFDFITYLIATIKMMRGKGSGYW